MLHRMTELHELRVFPGPDDAGGNPLGVVLDGPAVPADRRQALAARLGFSETVFVDDAATGAIAIFTPVSELPFAGHPTVGTGWLLGEVGEAPAALRPPAGEVAVWREDGLSWIRARAAWASPMTVREYGSPAEVDALDGAGDRVDFLYAWAWIDEAAGIVRARSFPAHLGIVEDEATGAAAVRLGDVLGRALTIRQGVGSVLHVRPGPDGTVEVGGRVALTLVRELPDIAADDGDASDGDGAAVGR